MATFACAQQRNRVTIVELPKRKWQVVSPPQPTAPHPAATPKTNPLQTVVDTAIDQVKRGWPFLRVVIRGLAQQIASDLVSPIERAAVNFAHSLLPTPALI